MNIDDKIAEAAKKVRQLRLDMHDDEFEARKAKERFEKAVEVLEELIDEAELNE